jgi:hypothetical protein
MDFLRDGRAPQFLLVQRDAFCYPNRAQGEKNPLRFHQFFTGKVCLLNGQP